MYQSMWYAQGWGEVQPDLHRNYFLLISPNLEQAEEDVAGVEHTNTTAPALSVDIEQAYSEPSGMATSDTTVNMSQG